jgi:hypothetical protein
VLLSVAPANAGVILEQPQIKKVRQDAAQLLFDVRISHLVGRTDQCRTVSRQDRELQADRQLNSRIGYCNWQTAGETGCRFSWYPESVRAVFQHEQTPAAALARFTRQRFIVSTAVL